MHSNHENLFPDSLDLPTLTSLHLQHFTFCVGDNDRAEPFSTFNRLNSLLISNSTVRGADSLHHQSVKTFNFYYSYITKSIPNSHKNSYNMTIQLNVNIKNALWRAKQNGTQSISHMIQQNNLTFQHYLIYL